MFLILLLGTDILVSNSMVNMSRNPMYAKFCFCPDKADQSHSQKTTIYTYGKLMARCSKYVFPVYHSVLKSAKKVQLGKAHLHRLLTLKVDFSLISSNRVTTRTHISYCTFFHFQHTVGWQRLPYAQMNLGNIYFYAHKIYSEKNSHYILYCRTAYIFIVRQ